jgi:PHD/YefM family antitoxin component YafN of YafNO toxin-antitoxin module
MKSNTGSKTALNRRQAAGITSTRRRLAGAVPSNYHWVSLCCERSLPLRYQARAERSISRHWPCAGQRQEPIIITQRGRDAAVLLPIELYPRVEQQLAPKILSPRLARPEDVDRFRMEIEVVSAASETSDAGV